jgi:site-specific recombinase XerD
VVSAFAGWLIEERDVLIRNPTRGVEIKADGQLAPRMLEPEQRIALRDLVERAGDLRGEAIFALGYWAGCRVSDVSWLRMEHTHVGPKIGWLHVGYKGGKMRDIDLLNEARRPLYDYLQEGHRDRESPFVFTSQRSEHLSEDGIHNWLQTLKQQATQDEWELVKDVTFHDLRHDFAHRARAAGWTLEELAYYLGHTTKRGAPAIQTTVRYTQISRRQLKEKLQLLKE